MDRRTEWLAAQVQETQRRRQRVEDAEMSRRVAESIAACKKNSAAKGGSGNDELGDDTELFEFYAGGGDGSKSRFAS